MSYQLMAWACDQRTGSPTDKAVLLALANRANHDTGLCCPSVARIADETELGESTVKRALTRLVENGFVRRERRRREDGALGTYDYYLGEEAKPGASQPELALTSRPELALTSRNQEVLNQAEVEGLRPSTSKGVSLRDRPPKLERVDGRDLAFDALAAICGIADGSPRLREVATALNGTRGRPGIREQFWREVVDRYAVTRAGESFERLLADAIRDRARLWTKKMPGATLTPPALAKWWTDLPGLPEPRDGRSGSAEDALSIAEAAVRAARGES
jgi:predicted transcriptional regulator